MKTQHLERTTRTPRVVVTWTHLCVLVIVCAGVVALAIAVWNDFIVPPIPY